MLGVFALFFSTLIAAPQAALRPATGVVVSGVVQDQSGAVLPGAQVELRAAGSATAAQSVVSDASGNFKFERVAPGVYEVHATFPGFKEMIAQTRVGGRAPGALTIVMPIEGLTQEVSVSSGGETSATARANLNAISVDENTLDDLPILDQDIVGAMSRFLDSSAIGTNGTTIIVDGVEVNALSLSASAVQQIKINQDPYSAEFMRPGRGRIEIVTKPGGKDFSGTFNVRFRDAALYARNAFAATKPPQQRRIFEGSFGGPVPQTEKSNFMLSGSYDAEDSQAVIFAQTPAGIVQANAPTPSRNVLFSATWNHQQGEKNTQSLRFSHLGQRNDLQGVGGVNLAESGSRHTTREDELTFSQQTILSSHLLHDVKFMVGDEYEPRTSLSPAPRIVVLDAFTGGGAQADSLRTEHHFTLLDAVTWSPGSHVIKAGINIPDWSWRGFDDRTNAGGTFYFSSLQDYAIGRPYSFIEQVGNGKTAFLEKVVGGFVQDEIRPRSNLSLDFGVRYDWQNFLHDHNNIAPRFSFALSPDAHGRTVVRGGLGIFYDRTGPGPIQDVLKYDGSHLLRYVLTDPGYPNPLLSGQTLNAQPSSVVQFEPGVNIPSTLQYSVGIERQLRPKTTLAVNVIGSRGYDVFRSRDINAPLPPLYLARPDPTRGIVREIESAGTQRTASLQFTVRGQLTRYFSGSAEYDFGFARNDTSGINWMPPNNYDLSLEYARADFNQKHRVELFGTLTPGKHLNFGISASLATGRPYSLTTGLDAFNEGTANARPAGVPRNSLEGPGLANVDLRWSRDFDIAAAGSRKRMVTVGVDAFNVLNRVNYNTPVGNLSSPFFGQAVSAQPPRRIQFSMRLRY
jgi:Carboxypeptidase regulatory-like domain